MSLNIIARPLAAVLLGLLAMPAAGSGPPPRTDAYETIVLQSHEFLVYHPDLRFRQLGMEARERGRDEEARNNFRNAARYGDKLSQAALADMLWNGQGGPADRALGYAWMDLAAERGTEWLVAQRERFWEALSADERERAVREGRTLYTEFGDPAATPRLERELRAGSMQQTGSRAGWSGAMRSQGRGDAGPRVLQPEKHQLARYWDPVAYRQWQDEELARSGR
ncbi:SEL1-like repeat protein [Stenotrophomonas maltophilia]|uniref:Sel1 domain-containing protein repeat-containing protein n=1 Tax=Stenotrophomonas maltophilia TaxID=40324 RepID=A0AB34TJM9_STEMA|nr:MULTISPECIES: SEL1-like repeat protein [Stenotrophomonas]KOO83347.1 Sel1 domain-containing protein repeat-containing protein [Stenotrophomonas maltophilia]KOQ71768.1 Sel1 domain-containing protein repeat-containing protein [Stenotrophomonas maltophilia]MBH1542498.1 SEL1-like repeat protein [Stenotrophomonas maltophilia]MBN4983127.1 SEL1-like repeat protein [Stenotrophomonas maltophilia]MDZ7475768.1 SEL1-like repeat protein [Stenotrophomonas pavanii]